MRKQFRVISVCALSSVAVAGAFVPAALWAFVVIGPLFLLGLYDYLQVRQTIRRNFPLLGRFRYLLEAIRPEIQQYFIETNHEGMPFSREQRTLVYARSKLALDTLPFGTQRDVYQPGYEWLNHSLAPVHTTAENMRVLVGGPHALAHTGCSGTAERHARSRAFRSSGGP